MRATLAASSSIVVFTMLLAACTTPSPDPTAAIETPRTAPSESTTPTAFSSPTPTATGSPVIDDTTVPVSFTFECYVLDESAPEGGTYISYGTMEDAWGNFDVISCRGEQHGQVITAEQQAAVSVSLPSFGDDDPYVILETLYSQCATANHGYLAIDEYTGFQDENVRGMLALCPHHPGADKLRAGLPAG